MLVAVATGLVSEATSKTVSTVIFSGVGASERFNVLFAKREHSLPNRFVATGVDVAEMSAIDEAVAG